MTPEEKLKRDLLYCIKRNAKYWANLKDDELSIQDRCDGVAFSILALLDGVSGLPPFDLVAYVPQDENDFDDEGPQVEVTISEMLHEQYYEKEV